MNDELDDKPYPIATRFRGFLPVVVDVETGGFQSKTDAILEIAASFVDFNDSGELIVTETLDYQVEPFPGANLEQAALEFTGIDPDHPDRNAKKEVIVFGELLKAVRHKVKEASCNRAILVGHNAHFDLGFVLAGAERGNIRRNPFHPFSVIDTASLSGLAFGQTVLAKACDAAGLNFNTREAHSAAYDTEMTARLFCSIVNRWQALGGWQWPTEPDSLE